MPIPRSSLTYWRSPGLLATLLWIALPLGLAQAQQSLPQPRLSPESEAKALELLRETMAQQDQNAGTAAPPKPVPPPTSSGPRVVNPASSARVGPKPMVIPPPQFESWPTPASEPSPDQPWVNLPTASPAEHAQGKTLYSFRAVDLDLKAALALFARANQLNIVPDKDVTGPVTMDVHNLPLDRVMQALLEANDYTWREEDGLIRVHATETRTFAVDYLRMTREGRGSSVVTLSSGSSGFGSGSGNGGYSGAMGGNGMGGGGMTGNGTTGGAGAVSGSSMNLKLDNQIDFWKELEAQLGKLLTEAGKEKLAVNMTAGLIQVTDRPSALKRVQGYLKELTESVARQVDIEAKIYDVALNDQSQFGIDWTKIIQSGAGQFALGGFPTVTAPSGDFSLKEDTFKFSFTDKTSSVVLRALQEQGEVSVVSQPRLRTLNNQTAIMKVGRDEPFFTEYSQSVASGAAQTSYSGDILSVITVGTVLTITPQVSTNGWITLDISPAITSLVDTRTSPSRQSSAPVLDIKQTSTIVRVRDNETIVMGGLIQNSEARTIRKTPLISDIPGLGKLFQGRFHAHKKSELVIFLTPRVVR